MGNDKKTSIKEKNSKSKENKKEIEHKVIVDTKETVSQKDDELTSRINQLYGVSSNTLKEEKQYDPKELEETRKKLILLLIGLIICGVVIFVILIDPFSFEKNENKSLDKNTEKTEEKDKNEIPLGEIDLSEPKVIELNNFVTFSVNDFMVIDLLPLYAHDSLESKNIPNNIKLFLLKRNEAFVDLLLESNIEEYVQTCDANGLVISKEVFDKVVTEVFGPGITIEYDNINYSYYNASFEEKKITLSYVNNQYVVKCNNYTTSTSLTKFVQQDLNKAIKTENAIEIYQNVVFIKESGVYKDHNFGELITNDKTAILDDYISKGSLYKYTFTEDEGNYYLTKIEKVKAEETLK